MDYEVIVVGSGPAGVEAARLVATAGLKTALVTGTIPGGRATVGSLLPSKVWLHSTSRFSVNTSEAVKLSSAAVRGAITARSRYVKRDLDAVGVEVIQGEARLTAQNEITVATESGERKLTGGHLVLATGSEPRFFPDVKPDGERIIAPRHTKTLQERPESLVMVGGGVTGVEYASVFARMGTEVTLVTDVERILPPFDHEYAIRLQEKLGELGVNLELNAPVASVAADGNGVMTRTRSGREFTSQYAFIATGRLGDLTFLTDEGPALKNAGGFLTVDEKGRTSIPHIYACGDVTGPPLTANKALLQARNVVNSILEKYRPSPDRLPTATIQAVYTQPELAQLGPVAELDTAPGTNLYRRSYDRSMNSIVHGESGSEVKIWVNNKDQTIVGAAAIGEHASEVLAVVQVAMNNRLPLSAVTEIPFSYPSAAEVLSL